VSLHRFCQLVNKVINDYVDRASSAKHFAEGKMLLRPKILYIQDFWWRFIVLRGGPCPLALPRCPLACAQEDNFLDSLTEAVSLHRFCTYIGKQTLQLRVGHGISLA